MHGLLTHELERFVGNRDGERWALSRVAFEILGPVPIGELTVAVETRREGRVVKLIEAVAEAGGRAAVRARAWWVAGDPSATVAGGGPPPLPAAEGSEPLDLAAVWPGRYIASLEARAVEMPRPGLARVWLRARVPVLAAEPVGDLTHYLALVDTANGIGVRRDPREWEFPNLDLTVHLVRAPRGQWVGLDTEVMFGAGGYGLTSTVLHDRVGALGRAEQSLFLRRRRS